MGRGKEELSSFYEKAFWVSTTLQPFLQELEGKRPCGFSLFNQDFTLVQSETQHFYEFLRKQRKEEITCPSSFSQSEVYVFKGSGLCI